MRRSKNGLAGEAAKAMKTMNPFLSGSDPQERVGAVAMMLRSTMKNPAITAKAASRIASDSAKIMMGQSDRAADPRDRRFKDSAWSENPFYKRGMQAYLSTQEHLNDWVANLSMTELEHARAKFLTSMITDAMAPTNTLLGNPAASKKVMESGGMSLLKGLKNAYTDITK
ncbi:MAG: class II poly(R)-hydroxyalkanoic acid synthase, partial [Hyphomonas sp.]|nr:class II poly(R)-hydroxyalkanoic acid synthase [Hyphomonas sp.]